MPLCFKYAGSPIEYVRLGGGQGSVASHSLTLAEQPAEARQSCPQPADGPLATHPRRQGASGSEEFPISIRSMCRRLFGLAHGGMPARSTDRSSDRTPAAHRSAPSQSTAPQAAPLREFHV